jgi:hypothetical protein
MAHVTAALTSFRMIAAVPHHLPRYIGFMAANRVDIDQFSRDAAIVGVGGTLITTNDALRGALRPGAQTATALPAPRRLLTGPNQSGHSSGGASTRGAGMDTTLRATIDVHSPADDIEATQ